MGAPEGEDGQRHSLRWEWLVAPETLEGGV